FRNTPAFWHEIGAVLSDLVGAFFEVGASFAKSARVVEEVAATRRKLGDVLLSELEPLAKRGDIGLRLLARIDLSISDSRARVEERLQVASRDLVVGRIRQR